MYVYTYVQLQLCTYMHCCYVYKCNKEIAHFYGGPCLFVTCINTSIIAKFENSKISGDVQIIGSAKY